MEGDTSPATPLPNTGQLKILKTDWESLKIYRPEVNTMSRAARDLQGFFFFFQRQATDKKKRKKKELNKRLYNKQPPAGIHFLREILS